MRTNPTAIQRLRAASTAVQSGQRPSYGARPSLIFLRADGWKSGEKHRLKNRFNFGLSNGECRQSIEKLGGRSRARTYDPLIKSQLLYQLSYAPGASGPESLRKRRRLAKRPPDVQQSGPGFPCPSVRPVESGKAAGIQRLFANFRSIQGSRCKGSRRKARLQSRSEPSCPSRSMPRPPSWSMPRSIQRCRQPPSPPDRSPRWVRKARRRFWPSSSVL
jgi:hypothetical protein